MVTSEYQFDGIVGPTHNYAGLSFGNVASMTHAGSIANPKEAALQGLRKMKFLMQLGIPQAVLPPLPRPDLSSLRSLGFSGTPTQIIERAKRDAPHLLHACYSASSMWAANAATVSPSADTEDGKLHLTPANLMTTLHRSLEAKDTAKVLKAIFPAGDHFAHHAPLPATPNFSDEGAANHSRLTASHGERGIELFVYGKSEQRDSKRFPARQHFEASQALARLHGLDPAKTLFVQQNPEAIDAGVFHNDVIAVANENVLLLHEAAWVDQKKIIKELSARMNLHILEISSAALTVEEAVATYFFNSQIVTLADGTMAVIAPKECEEHPHAKAQFDAILAADASIRAVHYLDVRESMNNGGGPACLRLRVALTPSEQRALHPGVVLTETLYDTLVSWVERHYRDRLAPDDLADPRLMGESFSALDALTDILGLGSVFDFQK